MKPALAKTQIYESKDYDSFKIIDGNRVINTLHLNKLEKSIKEEYLFSPIIVNAKYEIIDGQHRYLCCKKLNMPIYFVICPDYGLKEVHRYNVTSKNWSLDDFMNGYIELDKKEYVFYKQFREKYGFAHSESITMLTGIDSKESVKMFASGKLKIKEYNNACLIADKIKTIEPYYTGWRRRSFVKALILLLKNKAFNIKEFIEKLKYQQSKMIDCSSITQYVQVIEEIYNFKRKNGQRVNLRFSETSVK